MVDAFKNSKKPTKNTPVNFDENESATRLGKGVVGVIGGGGFLGRYVVAHLAQAGYTVKVGSRHAPRCLYLKTAAVPGRITLHAVDLRQNESIHTFIQGCDYVVNLVGLLFERGHQNFDDVHTRGAQYILNAIKDNPVKRLIHVCALGVNQTSTADYMRTKKAAEDLILAQCDQAISVRPSLVFGAEDQFFNRFAAMIRLSPIIPVFKGGATRFQPVYVDDVARGICALIENAAHSPRPDPRIYEFFGPKIYTFKELLELLMDVMGMERTIVSMPDMAAYALSLISKILPQPILTRDQFKMLDVDSIDSHTQAGLSTLNIKAHAVEDILPRYIMPTEQKVP